MTAPLTFHLGVLGPPSLRDPAGQVPPSLGWGKPLALLCLLAVRNELRRDEVVDLLWRDVDEDKARNAFRQALHRLRSALGAELLPPDRERLRLARDGRIAIDLDQFRTAVDADRLEEAIALYRGDFLEDSVLDEPGFDLWAEQERVRIRTVFRSVLERAIARSSEQGDWNQAVARSRRLTTLAPYDADAAQLAAATLVSAGHGRDARDLLARFASRLETELGLPAPPEIRALMSRLDRPSHREPGGPAEATAGVLRFTGRRSELARLLALWRTTSEDAGALALIEGQTGIGKSRLVHEFVAHARALRPGTVLAAREHAQATPLGIFADALRPLVRAPGVAGASPHLLAEAARLLPELRDTLDLPVVADVQDEAARLRFFEGIAALVEAAAYERPLLVVLEDLHHLPPSSLDLLTYLVARLAGAQVLWVFTTRPAGPHARIRAVVGADSTDAPAHGDRSIHLALEPLSSVEVAEAIGDLPARFGIPPERVERACGAAEGVPGRVAELVRRLAAGEEIALPLVSMRELIASRVERLTSAHRRLVLVLALLRRPVDVETLAGAAHLSSSAVSDGVRALDAEALVEWTDDERVILSETAAEVALDNADPDARAFLSRWIAEALAQARLPDHAELARFFAAGGDIPLAYENYRHAALSALSIGATSEAISYLGFARTFATSDDQRASVEGMLAALGSGRRRLVGGETAVDVAVDTPSAGPPPLVHEAAPARWERWFPNWRLLLGGAVATLLISTFVLARAPEPTRAAGLVTRDTLLVAEGEPMRSVRFAIGDRASGFMLTPLAVRSLSNPPWIDSLPRPWADAVANPRASHVALTLNVPAGRDVYVISADRRDTALVVARRGDARPLDWSPDGRWLLVTTSRQLPGGGHDADLLAVLVANPAIMVRFDSATSRSVVEAAWSPDGSRVAWVARVGAQRQLEVFVSRADGTEPTNLSRHPADDYHISWSGDGELLAFTSTRDGNAELYAFGFSELKTWRLTRDPAQDDRGRYSSDGRLIAFESTRGGTAAVYVMPGLGGEARRIQSALPLSVLAWRAGPPRYVDEVRVVAGSDLEPGDTTRIRVVALDQFGDSMATRSAELSVIDPAIVRLRPPRERSDVWLMTAVRNGLARVVASVGGWRTDTTGIRIGKEPVVLLQGADVSRASWIPLGDPMPTRAGATGGLSLNADRDWDSGILSREPAPLIPGLALSASLSVRPGLQRDAAASFTVSLVAPELEAATDRAAPQFLKYASLSWNAEAGRFVYAVGREVFTEALGSPLEGELELRVQIERDSTASFNVNGSQRWRSSLRVMSSWRATRAQAWIAARASDGHVVVRNARVELMGAPR